MKLELIWIIYKSNSKAAKEEEKRCTESLEQLGIKVKGKRFAIESLPPTRNKSTNLTETSEEEE